LLALFRWRSGGGGSWRWVGIGGEMVSMEEGESDWKLDRIGGGEEAPLRGERRAALGGWRGR
jgi:hypothetical protein